jgi:hypothetical protein
LGAYAPFYLKCICDIVWDIKKLKQKIRMYIFMCATFLQSRFMKNRLVMCKMTKFGAKNKAFHNINFVFLHRP